MTQSNTESRDLSWSWLLIGLTVSAAVTAVVAFWTVGADSTTLVWSVCAFFAFMVVGVVWSSLTITRNSKVSGDFVLFAGGFNILFAWAPVAGFLMNLVAAIRLLRGVVKGGTITTTSGSSSSTESMADTKVGDIAQPLGAMCLIAALAQPLLVGLWLLDASQGPAAQPGPPPAVQPAKQMPAEAPSKPPAPAEAPTDDSTVQP